MECFVDCSAPVRSNLISWFDRERVQVVTQVPGNVAYLYFKDYCSARGA
jgi:hypothetical protein